MTSDAVETVRGAIERAAAEVDELAEALEVARERRDRAVVRAVEEKLAGTRTVARWAGVSQSRVAGILAET